MKKKPFITWFVRLGSVALAAVIAGNLSAPNPQAANVEQSPL
ncbi:hypothetical protein [Effusibacillus dendaii]|nr:hypothetical protein [Effusibacillus dendaii]